MKETTYCLRKNIRLKTTLYNSNSAFMKNQTLESRKLLSIQKTHAKSFKTFKKIPTIENSADQTQRYNKNIITNSRITLKNSKKLLATYIKKKEEQRKRTQEIIYINLNHLHLTTKSWCMYDSKTKKYFGFRQDHKREIASLTKIMTTIVSIEIITKLLIPLKAIVKVTQNACNCYGTTANLRRQSWITLQDLLYGTMLPSGNDAALTLAQYLGYLMYRSKKQDLKIGYFSTMEKIDLFKESTTLYILQFIQQMNKLAQKIGLMSSTFSNPHGLANAMNISSAKDILKLSIFACKNKQFKKIANSRQYFYELFEDQQCVKKSVKIWQNTNKLLLKGWEGVKTGLTPSAGSCLSSNKQGLYIVVLNCSNPQTRFTDTQKLFNWYKNVYELQQKELQMLKNQKTRLRSQQMSIVEAVSTDIQI